MRSALSNIPGPLIQLDRESEQAIRRPVDVDGVEVKSDAQETAKHSILIPWTLGKFGKRMVMILCCLVIVGVMIYLFFVWRHFHPVVSPSYDFHNPFSQYTDIFPSQ